MADNICIVVDKKNQEGEFLCEKIIKSPNFQEKKDYVVESKDKYFLLSYELKKRILEVHNPSNSEQPLSYFDYKVVIDRENENYDEEFWERAFPKDKNQQGGNDKDKDNALPTKSSNEESKVVWWISGGVLFILFILLLVYLFRGRKKL